MKVKELMEALGEFDPDLEVKVSVDAGGSRLDEQFDFNDPSLADGVEYVHTETAKYEKRECKVVILPVCDFSLATDD